MRRSGWRFGRAPRAVLVLALLPVLGGCPAEGCEGPAGTVALVGSPEDPALGSFNGTIDWLQAGDQTAMHVNLEPAESISRTWCGGGSVPTNVAVNTTDDVLALMAQEELPFESSGLIRPDTVHVSLDTAELVAAGKLPEAPDILSRNPATTLVLELRADGTYSVVIQVQTTRDNFYVAEGTLTRAAP
jgi:hypothetical protein